MSSESVAKEATEAKPSEAPDKNKKSKKEKKPKKQLTEKQKTVRALRRLLTKIAVIAIAAVILLTIVGGVAVSHDNNMFPAVGDGDLLITYKLGGYYNGDIVVYEVDGVKRIGRVVGIPGDTIDIKDDEGYYTINGTMPYETIYFATRKSKDSTIRFPYQVQEGEVFIFNDMRDDTYDSRILGAIETGELQGKVVLLIRRRGF
ncbi:MAG: signal peptidase I [Firmicutes bacterium]|nr:signal peptidase I [Bacillota bacterium]